MSADARRKADKPAVLLYLAGCGMRKGMDMQVLDALRLEVAYAHESKQQEHIHAAKTALLEYYRAQSEIHSGENVMTPERAMASDEARLYNAVQQYDPNHQHPNYR